MLRYVLIKKHVGSFVIVLRLIDMDKVVPPYMLQHDEFCACWFVDVVLTSL